MSTAELRELCYKHYVSCEMPEHKIQFGEHLKAIIDIERAEMEKATNGPSVPKTKK